MHDQKTAGVLGLAVVALLLYGFSQATRDIGIPTLDEQDITDVDVVALQITPLASIIIFAVLVNQALTAFQTRDKMSPAETLCVFGILGFVTAVFYAKRATTFKKSDQILGEIASGSAMAIIMFAVSGASIRNTFFPGLLAVMALAFTLVDPAFAQTKFVSALAAASLFLLVLTPQTRFAAVFLYMSTYMAIRYIR